MRGGRQVRELQVESHRQMGLEDGSSDEGTRDIEDCHP